MSSARTTITDHLNQCHTSPLVHLQSFKSEFTLPSSSDLSLSYRQSFQAVIRHQLWLRDRTAEYAGLAASACDVDDVAVAYPADNSPDLFLSLLACMSLTVRPHNNDIGDGDTAKVRVLPAMINTRWTPTEIERAIGTTDGMHTCNEVESLTLLVYGRGYEQRANDTVGLLRIKGEKCIALQLEEFSFDYASPRGLQECSRSEVVEGATSREVSLSNEDAVILFTSGTSSPRGAKGVRLSHRSLYVQALAKTQSPCQYDTHTKVVATTVPLFHVGGLSSALGVMLGGGSLMFPPATGKGFQPSSILKSIADDESTRSANTLVVVPAMLHALIEYTKQQSPVFPNVRLILVGGQSIAGNVYINTRRMFPNARIVQTYACTEAGSSITFEDLGFATNGSSGGTPPNNNSVSGTSCVGYPPIHIQVEIFDQKSRHMPLRNGEMGIIGTRGPHTMSGYWSRGENNATFLSEADWMLTNDLGMKDPQSGKLYFCGRANDVIRTGGESVLANDVEAILMQHDDIIECAVFALPDEQFGECVCAALVLKQGTRSEMEDASDLLQRIRKHCSRHHLSGFKRPRKVFLFTPALPRNSSGKILKHEIQRKTLAESVMQRSRL
ncbi:hypothetical protein THAOC_26417 [Thalassiosira oceanica]|uniref:AMP-dependent synthetase/ligase domain-containing protein n=1 Tax=Thalassiosira oceanica TaxID=159749 RepID=K0S557_THAOC|nr:hypothetical protein THAOC_26417 [Thalassiosira oceanica]|eukprot:EJK54032.1 hypothetical protein THAOC_26417 [Thalassiosira oceanica]